MKTSQRKIAFQNRITLYMLLDSQYAGGRCGIILHEITGMQWLLKMCKDQLFQAWLYLYEI